jgi:hypothetical protein
MEPAPHANPDYAPPPVQTDLSKEEHERIFQRGLKWLGVGVFLMAISFAINFLLFQVDQSFSTPMYVLTSAGMICLVKGLGDILGF